MPLDTMVDVSGGQIRIGTRIVRDTHDYGVLSFTDVIVKSSNHFYDAFAKFAAEIIYVDCGGPYPGDPRKSTFTKLRRPIWPLDEDAKGEMFQ